MAADEGISKGQTNAQIGQSGDFLTAAVLAGFGVDVSVVNKIGFDILARVGERWIRVEVKSTRARQREIVLARGRRDLSTQLTTLLDCGEYNLCTRSRGASNGARGVRTLDASSCNRASVFSASHSEISSPYTSRAMFVTSAREHPRPRHIIARANG